MTDPTLPFAGRRVAPVDDHVEAADQFLDRQPKRRSAAAETAGRARSDEGR